MQHLGDIAKIYGGMMCIRIGGAEENVKAH